MDSVTPFPRFPRFPFSGTSGKASLSRDSRQPYRWRERRECRTEYFGSLTSHLPFCSKTPRNALRTLTKLVFPVLALMSTPCLSGEKENPTVGIVYNTKENSSLAYECKKTNSATLVCDFVQSSVRRKTTPEQWSERRQAALQTYESDTSNSKQDCDVTKRMLDILEGRGSASDAAKFARLEGRQREDMEAALKAMATWCSQKTSEHYLAFLRILFDKETRTCKVTASRFTQTFRRVRDDLTNTLVWTTVQERPEGPCGLVQLCRFSRTTSTLSKDWFFWSYSARKAVTNPTGLLMPGVACKDLDEREYLYDWKNEEERYVGCDYIEFSPL